MGHLNSVISKNGQRDVLLLLLTSADCFQGPRSRGILINKTYEIGSNDQKILIIELFQVLIFCDIFFFDFEYCMSE